EGLALAEAGGVRRLVREELDAEARAGVAGESAGDVGARGGTDRGGQHWDSLGVVGAAGQMDAQAGVVVAGGAEDGNAARVAADEFAVACIVCDGVALAYACAADGVTAIKEQSVASIAEIGAKSVSTDQVPDNVVAANIVKHDPRSKVARDHVGTNGV